MSYNIANTYNHTNKIYTCKQIPPVVHFLPVTIIKKQEELSKVISEYCRDILITERSYMIVVLSFLSLDVERDIT